MKVTINLTETDIQQAVLAWLALRSLKCAPNTFYLGVNKADRDYENDSYYAKIDAEI